MREKLILTEEQILEVGKNWTPRDFIDYYSQLYGVMTLEEFEAFNMKIIDEIFPKQMRFFQMELDMEERSKENDTVAIEVLRDDELSKTILTEDGRVEIVIKEGNENASLSVKEAAEFCAEVISEYQLRKYGCKLQVLIQCSINYWYLRNGYITTEDYTMPEFLFENEYGKHYVDHNRKISIELNEDAPEYLTPKETCEYCIEIISAMQIKYYGHLL